MSKHQVMTRQMSRSNKLIFLVDDDTMQAQLLSTQIGYFGYSVVSFSSVDALREALNEARPAAVLMDIVFPEGPLAGIEAIANLRESMPDLPPVFFVSGNNDMAVRIQAARAGGEAFFHKPVNISSIIDALDRMTLEEDTEPYRVLVIDDSRMQARTNGMILRKAGMSVTVVNDPMQMEGPLDESNPELILLDMYMENCTGLELAKSIRQMDAFLSVPIVFLSSETDREKQLEAVGLGGDDFLVKPIRPEHLVSAAKARLERYRTLRKFMYRDSLTGLLNHGMLKEQLVKECRRAKRQKDETVAYAQIDMDEFKSINDRYGHSVGDRVLKSLAQMLSRRLRITDIIGRYGGEEFGIIFPTTSGKAALRMMEELRESFGNIRHQTANNEFTATFSCGVATYPPCTSPEQLCNVADEALYQAKRQGRNQSHLME